MPLRIVVSALDPLDLPGEALVRPVNAALEGITPWSREVERAGGEPMRQRLGSLAPHGTEGVPPGGVVLTPGGGLPFAFVLHAVLAGPEEGVSRATVERAVVNALRRAEEWGVRSMVLPLLGAGPGQLAVEEAAEALVNALVDTSEEGLPELRISAGAPEAAEIVRATLVRVMPGCTVEMAASA
jgi:O-acetyl-ADP-ribose deacetylase (regulator of RNase III)